MALPLRSTPPPDRPGLPAGVSLVDLGKWLLTQPPEAAVALVGDDAGVLATFEEAVALARTLARDASAPDEPWRADPASLAHHLDPKYRLYRHTRYLSQRFVAATNGTSKRQLINLPGRYGKTKGLQTDLEWLLDQRPASESIFVSYGDMLAVETAIAVRDTLRRHGDVLRAQLRQDRQKRDRFVTEQGGGLLAAGINSTITGFGVGKGGVLIIDDPFKNWAEAHSEGKRRHVVQQFRGTLRNRLDDEDCGIIVCHHRMHTDDLTGFLRESMEDETGEAWELISLPALAIAGDALGRAVGEPLSPEQFPLHAVQARAMALGSYLTSALEQQNPSPEEGNELLRAWFRLEDAAPPAFDVSLTSWDLKLTNRETGDFVVGQHWGRTGSDYWLTDQIRGQFDHATTANAIALLAVRHPATQRHVIEAAASAVDVMAELRKARPEYVVTVEMAGRLGMTEAERSLVQTVRRRGMSGLIAHPARGDKSVRARTFIAPAAEAGNVHIVVASWTPHLMDRFATFPDGPDDEIDAASQALQKLARGEATVAASHGQVAGARASASPARPGPALSRFPRSRIS